MTIDRSTKLRFLAGRCSNGENNKLLRNEILLAIGWTDKNAGPSDWRDLNDRPRQPIDVLNDLTASCELMPSGLDLRIEIDSIRKDVYCEARGEFGFAFASSSTEPLARTALALRVLANMEDDKIR